MDLRVGDAGGEEGEWHGRVVACLHLQQVPSNAAAIEAGGRACLQAAEAQARVHQPVRKAKRRRLADAACRGLHLALMDDAAQEGARGQHDRTGANRASTRQHDAADGARIQQQILHPALDHVEPRRRRDGRLHRLPVELAVGLGPRPVHGGALGAIEKPELDAGSVRDAAHQAVEGIDLAHEVALAEPADGRVAGHLADGRELVRDERSARAHAGGGSGRFASRMASAHDDDVIAVGRSLGDGHGDTRSDQDRRE